MKVLTAFTALVATATLATASATPRKETIPSRDPTNEAVRQFDTQCGKGSGMVIQDQARGCVSWDPTEGDTAKGKSLADTLTLDRRGRVWWDYAREVDAIIDDCWSEYITRTNRLGNHETRQETNLNGATSDEEAERNVERFLAAHIIPDFNQPKTNGVVKNLLGSEVEIVEGQTEGSYIVKPGDIEVVELSQANNGRILYMDGVLPFRE